MSEPAPDPGPAPAPAPAPVNLGGLGDVDMRPVETHAAARTVYEAGKTFGEAWTGLGPAIKAAEQQLGQGSDQLGANFKASYNAYAVEAEPAADHVEEVYQGLGEAGAQAVVKYLEVDQQIVPERFRSIE
jgi:hypothetical protein